MVCLLKDVQVLLKVRRTLRSVGTSSSNNRPPILCSVQEYFWRADKVRRNTCEEARPSRLNLQRDKEDLDTKISTSLPQCRTEHSYIEGSIRHTVLDIKIIQT